MLLKIRLGAHISILRLHLAINSNHIMHGYVLYYNHYNLEPQCASFISYMTAYTHFFHCLGNLASCKIGNGLNPTL